MLYFIVTAVTAYRLNIVVICPYVLGLPIVHAVPPVADISCGKYNLTKPVEYGKYSKFHIAFKQYACLVVLAVIIRRKRIWYERLTAVIINNGGFSRVSTFVSVGNRQAV